jgi:hypothetical protein
MNNISHNIANESPDAIAKRLMEKVEYRDGLWEIAIGVMILMVAGQTGLPVVFKSWVLYWGMMLLFLLLGFGSQWVIKKVRKRFLIGKFGYVKLKPVNRKRRGIRIGIIVGLAFIIAGLATYAMVKVVIATHRGGDVALWGLFPLDGWLLLGMGIYGGALMALVARLPRYIIGGVIMATLGVLLALRGVSLNTGLTILYGFAGLLSLISGSVVFFLFLRQPVVAGE